MSHLQFRIDQGAGLSRPGGGQGCEQGSYDPGGNPEDQVVQAVAAEAAGWDGVFVWEGAYQTDAWCLLTAIAQAATRVRLGAMLGRLPWRRPWELAAQGRVTGKIPRKRGLQRPGWQ